MSKGQARIYKADTWHVDDGTGTDAKYPPHHNPVRRVFTAEYKLSILAEYLKGLRARGLGGVQMVISDHHLGLKQAIESATTGPSGLALREGDCESLNRSPPAPQRGPRGARDSRPSCPTGVPRTRHTDT